MVDFLSGDELAALNPGLKVEPASITKLMTAYILYRELDKGTIKVTDEVLVSEKAWKMEGSRMFVELGKKVPLESLLRGMIIQSGNDAAIALVEHVAGSRRCLCTADESNGCRIRYERYALYECQWAVLAKIIIPLRATSLF